jgi:hypothetical protein
MAFQEFTAKRGKFTPQVTINKGGGLGLSSGMHHKYGLDKFGSVKLYYDPDTKKVGIKLCVGESDGTFKLKKRPDEKGAYFGARSFLLSFDLNPVKVAGRYSPEVVTDPNFGEMFVITIKENTETQKEQN